MRCDTLFSFRYAALLSPGSTEDCRDGALAFDDMASPYVVPDTPPCIDLSGMEPRALAHEEQGAANKDTDAHWLRDAAAGTAPFFAQHPPREPLLLPCY